MARGGKRKGTPGKAYPQRSDLSGTQGVKVATGQPYGAAQQQREAQQAIPLPQSSRVAPARSAPAPASQAGPVPGSLTALDAPTARPNEPLTAGLPMGPGAGPEALGMANTAAGSADPSADKVRALYMRYPHPDLARLIEDIEARGR